MKRILIAAASLAMLCPIVAEATPVLDQSNYSWDTGIGTYPSLYPGLPVGQSFTAGLSGLLTTVGLASNGQIEGPGTLTMEIFSGNGFGGTDLGSLTVNYAANNPYDYGLNLYLFDVDVSSLGINVTAGQQYTFDITGLTGDLYPRGILGAGNNPYSGGEMITGSGGAGSYDLVFTTSVDQQVPDTASTLALLGVAVAALAAARYKTRTA